MVNKLHLVADVSPQKLSEVDTLATDDGKVRLPSLCLWMAEQLSADL